MCVCYNTKSHAQNNWKHFMNPFRLIAIMCYKMKCGLLVEVGIHIEEVAIINGMHGGA